MQPLLVSALFTGIPRGKGNRRVVAVHATITNPKTKPCVRGEEQEEKENTRFRGRRTELVRNAKVRRSTILPQRRESGREEVGTTNSRKEARKDSGVYAKKRRRVRTPGTRRAWERVKARREENIKRHGFRLSQTLRRKNTWGVGVCSRISL
ncbi:hypothetical protein MTO96_005597 [Rhipicephalus appendiculatus]